MDDPEIGAMTAVSTALTGLDQDAQGRVLRWAAERYGTPLEAFHRSKDSRETGAADGGDDLPVTDEDISAEAPQFEHFAELFNAAHPKTDVDKSLVGGYWFQAIQGESTFQAAQINTELKHLGHALGNVTDALASNQTKKPARVIQLRKSGSSRQARKTYKLTNEGLVYVQGMIGHGG